ncbi:Uncharacterised protein [Serratia grimesii]|jgi:hypothetical protein|uniref:Uncharacterized protein n=1 Tax=Serratia grimesii TaxID=82995 RepID=A0A7G2JKL6_9GAMM|nr:hypothetical protein [Serratia grimesii]CAI0721684.1 Uncharacterised protein [Serratia grimesii]CAI0891762.1 Uncharacterised protein [Serratia grimesii]CAI1140227.1 Uncharacterised protein [Serratia grimesii]CAI1546738.1 Uncharacterised protein [Serratia grimesii]CAI2443341.1 Uncharacterised protein [Serratia grimesii]
MMFRQWIPALLIVLSGCSTTYPSSSYSGWDQLKQVTREQKQRIRGGESVNAVLNQGRASIGGTIDWSKLWDR